MDRNQRKRNRILKKELKDKRKKARKVTKIKRRILSTMDWCDLYEVKDNEILLKGYKGKSICHLTGVKVSPHNIFLDDEMTVMVKIDQLRIALNKMPFRIYWTFVTSPVNIEDYKARLYDLRLNTDSLRIQSLIADDYRKAEEFESFSNELEFMLFVRDKDERILETKLQTLYREINGAGLRTDYLKKMDYLNYISYIFENPLINSLYFQRGFFEFSNELYEIENNEVVTRKIESDDWMEKGYGDIEFVSEEKMNEYRKSKMVPTSFVVKNDHMMIGNKYACVIQVTGLPSTYSEGLLCWYLNRMDIKVLMTTERNDMNISSMIRKDMSQMQEEYATTNDTTLQHKLRVSYESMEAYLDRIVRNNDITLDCTLVLLITADKYDDLVSKKNSISKLLDKEKFSVQSCIGMQEQILRLVCPVLLESDLPREIRNNCGILLPAEGIAGLYPFVYETLKDTEGFLFGYELTNGGVILFDPFAYKREQWRKRSDHQRTNGNMVIVGKSGFGKTWALNLMLRNDIREGYNVVAIDPENKINRLIRKYGGSIINYGVSNNIINIFDLRPLSTDEDETSDTYDREKAMKEMWDTDNAINFVIGQVNQVFSYLFKEYSDEEASIMGDLIRAAYRHVGIKTDEEGRYPSFRYMKSEDMPTFSTVREILLNAKRRKNSDFKRQIYEKLEVKFNRVCGEWGIYLDGHTSLKFENTDTRKIVAFGTKQLQNVSEQLRTALNHIMYNYAWSLCIDNEEWSSFILDEAHVNILQGDIAGLTAQFVRRARKYNTCVRLATQEPRDFADERILTHGKAIFNNSAYKLVFHLDKDPVNDVAKLMSINDNEMRRNMAYNVGEALFVCGERRIPIKVWVTQKEEKEI